MKKLLSIVLCVAMMITAMIIPSYAVADISSMDMYLIYYRSDANANRIENTDIQVSNSAGATFYGVVSLDEVWLISACECVMSVPDGWTFETSDCSNYCSDFDWWPVKSKWTCFAKTAKQVSNEDKLCLMTINIPAGTTSGYYTVEGTSPIIVTDDNKEVNPDSIELTVHVVNTDEKTITVNGTEKNITQLLASDSAEALAEDASFVKSGNTTVKVAAGEKVVPFSALGLTGNECCISVNGGEINYSAADMDNMFVYIDDTGAVLTGHKGAAAGGFLFWKGVTSIDDKDHAYTNAVTTPATCGVDGKIEYHCANKISKTSKAGEACDAVNAAMTETISKETVAHSYGQFIIDKAATCSEAGSKSRSCTLCGNLDTVEIPATGNHTWVADGEPEATADGTVQHQKCEVCGTKGPDKTTGNNKFYLTATKIYTVENKGTDSAAAAADQTCAANKHENGDYGIESGKLVDVEFRLQTTSDASFLQGLDSTIKYDKENLQLISVSYDKGLTNKVTVKNDEAAGTYRIQTLDAEYAFDGTDDYLLATLTFMLKNDDVASGTCLPVDFVEGSVNQNCMYSDGSSNYPVTEGIGFTNVTEYTVTWDWNHQPLVAGEEDPEDQVDSYAVGKEITKPTDPTRTGFEFKGWDANDDDAVDASDEIAAEMPAKDLTYKAIWEAKTYDVVFNHGDHGTLTGEDANGKVTVETKYGQEPTAPAVTPAAGYEFAGWNPEIAEVVGENPTLEYTATYNALPQSLKINFTSDDAIKLPANIDKEVATDAAFEEAIPAIEGYTAKIVEVDPENAGITVDAAADTAVAGTMIAGGITVTVKYSPKQVDITFNEGDHGTIADADDNGNKVVPTDYNKTPEAPAVTPAAGYEFTGWNPEINPATGKTTYTAQYKAIAYDLVIKHAAADDSEVPADYTAKVDFGSEISYAIPEKTGYTAMITAATDGAGITVDENNDTEVAGTMPAKNVEVTVTYTPVSYDITFKPGDHGTIDGADDDGNKVVPTDYSKTPKAPAVNPNTGYEFDGWTPEVVPATGETTYTATYVVAGAKNIVVEDYMYATTDMYMIRIPKMDEGYDVSYDGNKMFISEDVNYKIDGKSVFVYLIPKTDFDDHGIDYVISKLSAADGSACIEIDYNKDTDENENGVIDNNDATQVYQLLISHGDCYTNGQVSIERRLESDTNTATADATYRGSLKDVEDIIAARGNAY